jgi:hypothetical protein
MQRSAVATHSNLVIAGQDKPGGLILAMITSVKLSAAARDTLACGEALALVCRWQAQVVQVLAGN